MSWRLRWVLEPTLVPQGIFCVLLLPSCTVTLPPCMLGAFQETHHNWVFSTFQTSCLAGSNVLAFLFPGSLCTPSRFSQQIGSGCHESVNLILTASQGRSILNRVEWTSNDNLHIYIQLYIYYYSLQLSVFLCWLLLLVLLLLIYLFQIRIYLYTIEIMFIIMIPEYDLLLLSLLLLLLLSPLWSIKEFTDHYIIVYHDRSWISWNLFPLFFYLLLLVLLFFSLLFQ